MRRWILLGLMALILAGARWHTRHEPLQDDLTLYAVIGHELNAGRALYSDLWDNKPPAVYAVYAFADRCFGETWRAVYAINLFFALIVLAACYRAGGVWAALFWTVVAGDLYLEGNQPNTELMMNACLTAAAALLWWTRGDSRRHAINAGVLMGLACLFKPIAVFPAFALTITSVRWRDAAIAAAGVIAAVCAYFALTGRWAVFAASVVTYNQALAVHGAWAGSPFHRLCALFSPGFLTSVLPNGAWRPWLLLSGLSLLGMAWGWLEEDGRWRAWLAWAAGTWVAIALPGYFFPHYFQLGIPVLCIGAAWLVADPRFGRWAGAITVALLLLLERDAFRLSPEDSSRVLWGDRFVIERDAARQLAQQLPAGETFYQWGTASGLYFYSGRRPPSGAVWQPSVVEGPLAATLSARVVRDLERTPPLWIVTTRRALAETPPASPVFQWMRAHYRPRPQAIDGVFFVFERMPAVASAR